MELVTLELTLHEISAGAAPPAGNSVDEDLDDDLDGAEMPGLPVEDDGLGQLPSISPPTGTNLPPPPPPSQPPPAPPPEAGMISPDSADLPDDGGGSSGGVPIYAAVIPAVFAAIVILAAAAFCVYRRSGRRWRAPRQADGSDHEPHAHTNVAVSGDPGAAGYPGKVSFYTNACMLSS